MCSIKVDNHHYSVSEKVSIQTTQFYDINIKAKSFEALNSDIGWEVFKSEKIINNYYHWTKNVCVVGLISIGNIDKSFVLSQILSLDYPVQSGIIREGLNVKFYNIENNKFTFLVPETNSTLLLKSSILKYYSNFPAFVTHKKMKESWNDESYIFYFLHQFVISHSHITIAIVGEMTYQDQLFLKLIKNNHPRNLIVIHNLMNFQISTNVKQYLKNTLRRFTSNINEKYYIESISPNDSIIELYKNKRYFLEEYNSYRIDHIIIENNNNLKPKNYFNNMEFLCLKQVLLKKLISIKKFDVIQKIMEYLIMNIRKNQDDLKNISYQNNKIQLIGINHELIIQNFFSLNTTIPKYSVYLKTLNENEQKLVLDFEIKGEEPKFQISFKSNNYFTVFRARGETISKLRRFNKLNDLKINKFDFRFRLKSEDFTINQEELNIEYLKTKEIYNGIVRVTYPIEITAYEL